MSEETLNSGAENREKWFASEFAVEFSAEFPAEFPAELAELWQQSFEAKARIPLGLQLSPPLLNTQGRLEEAMRHEK